MLNEVGVVIPYYHKELTDNELISYIQCKKILGDYPIILVVPDNISDAEIIDEEGIVIERVPKEWLESISTYNTMMLNIEFYKRFQKYKYILIYQLDAFVFSDKLLEMCEYNYDYIGAPWLMGYFDYLDADHCVWRVGNGGFSLRKVQSFIELLSKKEIIDDGKNEDVVFSISNSDSFKVAPLDVALKFAFEREVRKCFELNNKELPFGCHAWEKYDLEFLSPIIDSYGYDINTSSFVNSDADLEELYESKRKISYFWENTFSINWLKKKLPILFSKQIQRYVIWGAGYDGKLLCKILKEAKLPLKLIIDSNPRLTGKKIGDIEITDSYLKIWDKNDGIIIAVRHGEMEVVNLLNERGLTYKKDYILFSDIIDY